MEEMLPQNDATPAEKPKKVNFHEVALKRKELRKVIKEQFGIDERSDKSEVVTGSKGKIYEKHYKPELKTIEEEAATFKKADFIERGGAKKILKKQKDQYEEAVLDERSQIDYKAIEKDSPEIQKVQEMMENLAWLRDLRMRRMFEILNPKVFLATKKRNEALLKTIKEEIKETEESLEGSDRDVLRQAELVEYKENLAESGHICITPTVEKDLEAIGDRMLTGKPMFLHGPTGTGKTSLARLASKHFTGNDPEMIFCNPQTKESNVWGKTGIRPAKGGAIETVEIYGPLAKAMAEGKTVIFDEFTALPKEQMVFIKGVFNAKVGDSINIVGNGMVEIQPGFQMIFTANLKSEKNPERQELPPEIAREFEQNNVEINYTPEHEAYDIMLARMMNPDGSLDMSWHDVRVTLPNFCKAIHDIQIAYTDKIDKEVARNAGVLDASGKSSSLKKFVMTQGSVEAILSSWLIEKKTGSKERSFAEFLDDRLKTALTFKEYGEGDRVLVAKILAARGFLTTLDPKNLGLDEKIFDFAIAKKVRGEDAVRELKEKSGKERHITLRELAELDPFNIREHTAKADEFLSDSEGVDQFSKSLRKRLNKITGQEGNKESAIEATHTYKNEKGDNVSEVIKLSLESALAKSVSLYQKTGIDLPPDFEAQVEQIWQNNYDAIKEAIEKEGFNEIILAPANIPLTELSSKMKTGNGYGDYVDSGGNTVDRLPATTIVSQDTDKIRLILVHKAQSLADRPALKNTLKIKAKDTDVANSLSVDDYIIFQRQYFEETGKHLDEDQYLTWTPKSKSGTRFVYSCWSPDFGWLDVGARVPEISYSHLGCRPSRYFF